MRCAVAAVMAAVLCWTPANAQEEAPEYGWKSKMVAALNFTQANFSNWSSGGENSLAWQAGLKVELVRTRPRSEWVNKGRLEFGLSRVGDTGTCKSADEIRLESILTYKNRGRHVNPYVSATARTQLAPGYNYDTTPKTQRSQFLDPGYFTQSAGVGFQPRKGIKTRLGATLKETVTRDYPVPFADDPDTPELEKTRVEGGVTSVTEVEWTLRDDLLLTSSLELFSNLKAFDEIDMTWENQIALKVTRPINVNFTLDLVYDKDVIDDLQVKQVLAVGLSYQFL